MGPYENISDAQWLVDDVNDPNTGYLEGDAPTGTTTGKQGGNAQVWTGLAIQGINSISDLIRSITGKYPNQYYPQQTESKNNTWIIVIAVLVVVVILAVVLANKK